MTTQGNLEFKGRLKTAVQRAAKEIDLDLLRTQRLYTPVWRDRQYRWVSPMDTDGILARKRKVHWEDATPLNRSTFRTGVIVQSEFTTSIGKPNPFGKALIGHLPLGVWIDLQTNDPMERMRVRLDLVIVLFVLPTPAAVHQQKIAKQALKNVTNAADAGYDCEILRVRKGDSAAKLADQLIEKTRPWLIGAGRPRL